MSDTLRALIELVDLDERRPPGLAALLGRAAPR